MRGVPNFACRIEAGEIVVGSFIQQIAVPETVEVFAEAGFEFVIIDMEHGPIGFDTVRNLVRAAHGKNISAFCRVSTNEPHLMMQALDVGTDGIIMPHVSSASDIKAAIASCKFPPEGYRSFCSGVRAAKYLATVDYTEQANRNILVIPIIEEPRLIEDFDEVLAIEDLKAVLVGPGDLSVALGHPWQLEHPEVRSRLDYIVESCVCTGIPVGMHVRAPEQAKYWIDKGVSIITIGIDAQILLRCLRETRQTIS